MRYVVCWTGTCQKNIHKVKLQRESIETKKERKEIKQKKSKYQKEYVVGCSMFVCVYVCVCVLVTLLT